MSALVAFLRARLDEDSAAAHEASGGIVSWSSTPPRPPYHDDVQIVGNGYYSIISNVLPDVAAHVIRHDPARTQSEIWAKRRVIDRFERAHKDGDIHQVETLHIVLRLLAFPYAAHPDYRGEWSLDA